ncbi:MAG: orotidine-5'-phosphate decarboxylase [Brevinematales bacterium]|nr:orotidine-5'-phosphate decarboxylase [Brevinematales bacterium]
MATKLIVVLDMQDFPEAKKMIDLVGGMDVLFKVGSTLYPSAGRQVIEYIKDKGRGVFLDLKFFDIPNQVMGACEAVSKLGVDMFTIHLMGGREMVRGAIEGVSRAAKPPLILGVTVLTSMNDDILKHELRMDRTAAEMVEYFAESGYSEGLRGFVCSPLEIAMMKRRFPDAKVVTPGIRPDTGVKDDQKRVMTPRMAAELGADYIVVGRPISEADDPAGMVERILADIG